MRPHYRMKQTGHYGNLPQTGSSEGSGAWTDHVPAMTYTQRLLALPSVQEWVEAGRTEPWVDAAHDEDCRQAGEVVHDYREHLRSTPGAAIAREDVPGP